MRKIIVFAFLFVTLFTYGKYGIYKTEKIKHGKAKKIPGRPESEKWNYITLYNKKGKAFLKIYTRLNTHKYSADFYKYIVNLTGKTMRFYLVLELRYIFKKGFKIVLGPKGVLGPKKLELQLGGNFNIVDWGVVVYKKWVNIKSKTGKGMIEYWD